MTKQPTRGVKGYFTSLQHKLYARDRLEAQHIKKSALRGGARMVIITKHPNRRFKGYWVHFA